VGWAQRIMSSDVGPH